MAAAKEVDMKKMELMKEVRAHQVAIGELNSLPPSRAAYKKTCNIFFRKDIKSAVASQQSMIDAHRLFFLLLLEVVVSIVFFLFCVLHGDGNMVPPSLILIQSNLILPRRSRRSWIRHHEGSLQKLAPWHSKHL